MTDQTGGPAEHRPAPAPKPAQPTSNPVFRDVLKYGAILALVIAAVGAIVGGIFAGWVGIVSAVIGTLMALVFLSITAISILVANRFIGSDLFAGIFFAVVLGGWIVKFVLFIVLAVTLKDQPWINPVVLFLSLIAGVIGSLVVDMVVVHRSRLPYASDVTLPGGKG